MRLPVRPTVSALAATLMLAATVTTASAARLSPSNQNMRATWTSLESVFEFATIRCQVTLEGSFHTRSIMKVARLLIGYITRAMVKQEACTNGRMAAFNGVERYNGTTAPNLFPYHFTYESFAGTLPNITAVNFLFSQFRFGLTFTEGLCAGQYGAPTDNITLTANREAGGGITELTPRLGSTSLNLIRRDAGIFCPATGTVAGRGSLMLLGTTTRITITLI